MLLLLLSDIGGCFLLVSVIDGTDVRRIGFAISELEGCKMKDTILATLAFAVIFFVLYLLYVVVNAFVVLILSMNVSVSAPLLGGVLTVLGSVISILLSQYYTKKRESQDAFRQKKIEIFEKHLSFVIDMMELQKIEGKCHADDKELAKRMMAFKCDLIKWGNPKVIKAQIEFENLSLKQKDDHRALFVAFDELYLAIRKDLGFSNRGLNNQELLALILTPKDRQKLQFAEMK